MTKTKPTPENKAMAAPENKGAMGNDLEHAKGEIAAQAKELNDAQLLEAAIVAREAVAAFDAEIASRGLKPDNAMREGKPLVDFGETVPMVFTKSGSFNLDNGYRISGSLGDECAISPAEAERAEAEGIMAAPGADLIEQESETE